jgi:hypothetical protein
MTYPPAPPWEGPGNPFQRWGSTAVGVLFRPEASFAAMSPGPAGPSIAYAGLGVVFAQVVSSVPMLALSTLAGVVGDGPGLQLVATFGLMLGGAIVGLALTMTVLTLLTHGLLAISGGAAGGFAQTVRAIAYGYGSAAPGLLLPYCGWPLFSIAGTVSAAFGLAALHRISLARAVVALLVPAFVSGGLVVALLAAALANAHF